MKLPYKLISNIKQNLLEYYTLILIVLGLPVIALLYGGIKPALTVFILSQITIGIFALRSSN